MLHIPFIYQAPRDLFANLLTQTSASPTLCFIRSAPHILLTRGLTMTQNLEKGIDFSIFSTLRKVDACSPSDKVYLQGLSSAPAKNAVSWGKVAIFSLA